MWTKRCSCSGSWRATAVSLEQRPSDSRGAGESRDSPEAADDVLVNSGTVAELRQAVDRLHQRYLQLARSDPALKLPALGLI